MRLYSNNTIRTLNVSFDLGNYNLYADGDQLLEDMVGEGRSVLIRPEGKQLHVSVNETDYGTFNTLRLEATDTACILCINPEGSKQRTYEGDLEVSLLKSGSLQLINNVEFETYIAGVVQSEIYGKQTDIFRIQAIISRTWALRNMGKHRADGYNFCDHVHCQAYHNRCIRPDIMMGAIQSSGETLVDQFGALIETPFHSNSGGETANSEDVWRAALPYLRSVADTFSYRMRQSDWTTHHQRRPLAQLLQQDTQTEHRRQRRARQPPPLHPGAPSRAHPRRAADTRARRLAAEVHLLLRQRRPRRQQCHPPRPRLRPRRGPLAGGRHPHGLLGIAYDSILRHYYTGAEVHQDPHANRNYVEQYVEQINRIIEEDKNRKTQTRSKKDDWLGRLFRLRDREEREEVYIEAEQDNEKDWEYEW